MIALVAIIAAGTFAFASSAAAVELDDWAVWGSLTPKKLNEPVVLPKGSTFNGEMALQFLSETEVSGTASGTMSVPPFQASLKLVGLIPTTVGVSFEQVGSADGTIVSAPAAACAGSHFGGDCVTLSLVAHVNIGITAVGILGLEVPTRCETSEPIAFPLSTTARIAELIGEGPHFTGTVTIPTIRCEGLAELTVAPLLTTLMSGPDNPYTIHIGPHEPTVPTIVSEPASSVSQVSALLNATVDFHGEEITSCEFEYGTPPSYVSTAPCEWPPRAGNAVSTDVSGLSEETSYHFRIVASNPLGKSTGNEGTFETLSAALAPQYATCRALKHGSYSDSNCDTLSAKAGKGHYELYPGPAPSCVAQKKGAYVDSACSTKSAKPHKGTYEKTPGPGYASTVGPVTLEAPALGQTVLCTGGTASGEVTGLSTGHERLALTGCESSGKSCASEGANGTPSGQSGTIDTNLLGTRLLGPVEGAPWVQLTSGEHQPYTAEFKCGSTWFRTAGSLSGVQSGDVETSSVTSLTSFGISTLVLSQGEQAVTMSTSSNGTSWTSPSPSWQTTRISNVAASATEVRP